MHLRFREHGDSTNYEQLRDLLITEFRTPGAYYSHIQSFCNGRQGDRQKVAGYYRYLTNESSKINEIAKEKYKNDKPIVHPEILIAKFLGGISDDKIKE